MTSPPDEGSTLERRLAALEETVARLSALLEPSLSVSKLAAPIASVALKDSSQHQFSSKFFALLDLGESLLKYGAALGLADAVAAGRMSAESVALLFRAPPSLGKLAELLRTQLDDTSSAGWTIDRLREAFRRPARRPTPNETARYLFEEFLNVRNTVRGHGSQQPEGYYEGLYLKHHLTVHDCIKACKFIELPLVSIHAVDNVDAQHEYRAAMLLGITPESILLRSPTRVSVGDTCVWDHGSRLLPLIDLVSFRYCPVCSLEHVFFAEQITADRIYFHSYTGNHRFDVPRAAH